MNPSRWFLLLLLTASLCTFALTPVFGSPGGSSASPMQTTRVIALALSHYAADHGGKYPEGGSSTEVFQKLLDGNYVTDPDTFYLLMAGKTPSTGGRLQPQNVCYDVTAGVSEGAPGGLPVVFVTGFRLAYQPGGHAISLTRPFPAYAYSAEAWMRWLAGGPLDTVNGLAEANKSGDAQFLPGEPDASGFGDVPNVLPIDFDPRGAAYRQLTPAGAF